MISIAVYTNLHSHQQCRRASIPPLSSALDFLIAAIVSGVTEILIKRFLLIFEGTFYFEF